MNKIFVIAVVSETYTYYRNSTQIFRQIINAIIELLLDFLFFFTQFFQIGGIHRLLLAANVCVPILINQAFSLALSCPQDASFVVFALFGHCQTPSRDGKSLDMTHLLYHIKAPIYTTNFK